MLTLLIYKHVYLLGFISLGDSPTNFNGNPNFILPSYKPQTTKHVLINDNPNSSRCFFKYKIY